MCTNITLKSTSGDIFWGRTMDLNVSMFGEEGKAVLPSEIISIPKGTTITNSIYEFETKYNMLGVGVSGTKVLMDGINENGLVGDIQVLKECTHASLEDIKAKGLKPLIADQFVSFVLSQYGSVQEIRDDIQNYAFAQGPYEMEGVTLDNAFQGHYTFIDPSGDAIVLETLENGEFTIFDHIGVMTNSPQYNWHTTNIRNYIGVSTTNPSLDKTLKNGYQLEAIEGGTGYNMYGIPGDYTAVSRFVRAFLFSQNFPDFESEKGITSLYEVFRSVMVPNGLEYDQGKTVSDASRYWVGYDLTNRKLVVQSISGLAFTQKDLASASKVSGVSAYEIDLTDNLNIK